MDIVNTQVNKLEKDNSYVVDLGDNRGLKIVTVVEKFENSTILRFENGEEKIYPEWQNLRIYDHVPVKYFRKRKLDEIEESK